MTRHFITLLLGASALTACAASLSTSHCKLPA